MCQARDEFIKWYQEVMAEPIEAFRKHTATCPDCQEWLLSQRDSLGLGILSISDEDLKRRMSEGKGLRREVKPAKLPRFPRFAVCPSCGKGGDEDTTVCSYVDAGMPEDSPRFIGCGYCGYDGPAPDHPLYPKKGKHN